MKKKMMSTAVLTCAALGLAAQGALADGPTELGVIAGEPSGISMRTWLGGNSAFTAAAAWSFLDQESLHVHGDFTRRVPGFIETNANDIGFYYGIGGLVEFHDEGDDRFGVRAPLGIDYLMESAPISFFGEAAPVLDVSPDTEVNVNAAIGARYVF